MATFRIPRDLGLRSGALVFAVLLWFHLATEKDNYERLMEVPIVLTGVPTDRMVAEPIPEYAQVRFRGNGKQLLLLTWRSVVVEVDVSDIQTRGSRSIDLSAVRFPEGRDLEAVEVVTPQRFTIELDRRVSLRLPVTAITAVTPAPGHALVGPPSVFPDSVTVTGPASGLATLRTVWTDTLRRERVRGRVAEVVTLQRPDLFNLILEQRDVQVNQDVQAIGERTLEEVPVTLTGVADRGRYLVQPRTARVTVSGGVRLLEELKVEQVTLTIDLRAAPADGLTPVAPRVLLPTGITLLRLDPPTFRVTEY
jgi:YbbR domain-containing protein